MATKEYTLGNCLRGYFYGNFASIDVAWKYLSKRFLLSYPAKGGRIVQMFVREENKYGYVYPMMCKGGTTWIGNKNKSTTLRLCKGPSNFVA